MTNTITAGAEILSRSTAIPLSRRDVAWLKRDGYRLYCRYCEHPHKSREAAMRHPCCKRMELDAI